MTAYQDMQSPPAIKMKDPQKVNHCQVGSDWKRLTNSGKVGYGMIQHGDGFFRKMRLWNNPITELGSYFEPIITTSLSIN